MARPHAILTLGGAVICVNHLQAASLLEADIVTADGAVRIVNACTQPDRFWAIPVSSWGDVHVTARQG